MKKLLLVTLFFFSLNVFSHTINYKNQVLRHWYIQKEMKYIYGSFSMYKSGKVYIEDAKNNIFSYPILTLSKEDQNYALQKEDAILKINSIQNQNSAQNQTIFNYKIAFILLFLLAFGWYLYKKTATAKLKYVLPILSLGVVMTLYSFTKKMLTTTDPAFVNSAFNPFIPNVATSWDNTYFYVESKGIPNHTMMVGISNHGWQQQVPVPQCYIGTNHWSIPLNPVLASTPVPVSATHFLKGAIAIAANGVPIFNYHTNTGVDSYLDGQLDNYGGHCGRGDDYHYHTAPLHLYTLGQTTTNLPCAFALDGYAVYGSVEPNGSPMSTLDVNHGHYGTNGVYHYHGTATAPYMIGNMVGVVTEDANLQIIPQAASQPVRNENWTPLNNALITSCTANATNNGYNLSYTLNSVSGYATNFSWTGTTYTFRYVTPTGTTITNYNGFSQCTVPLATTNFSLETAIKLYPNPGRDLLHINFSNTALESDVLNIYIYSVKGDLVSKTNKFFSTIDIKNFAAGTYFVKIQFSNSLVTKKLIIQ